jgi:hypothetical protein
VKGRRREDKIPLHPIVAQSVQQWVPKPWHKRQKQQGIKLVLSWFEPRKCWKKYHGGDVKYFKQPDSADGYEAAVLEFHAWLHERKHTRPLAAEYEHHIQIFRQCLDWCGRFGTPEDEEEMVAEIAKVLERLEANIASEEPLPPVSVCLNDGFALLRRGLAGFFWMMPFSAPKKSLSLAIITLALLDGRRPVYGRNVFGNSAFWHLISGNSRRRSVIRCSGFWNSRRCRFVAAF